MIALITLLVYGFIVISVLAGHDWDALAFVVERPEEAPLEQTWAIGYDGQHAYAIARDPFNPPGWIDQPAFRYMRIVYPILAGLLAFEVDQLIPWTMLFINIAATVFSVYLLAQILEHLQSPSWPALIFPITFNYLIGVRFDLNEPLAFVLVLLGLRMYQRQHLRAAIIAFALAGLTKEIALAFPIGLALFEFAKGRGKVALAVSAGSLAPYLGWALIVTIWQGASPYYRGLAPLSLIPFAGFFQVGQPASRLIIILWALAPTGLAALFSLWTVLRAKFRTIGPEPYLVLANVAVLGTIPVLTWVDPLAVLRTGLGAMISTLLLAASLDRRVFPFLAALWVPSMLVAFLIPGFVI
jgi:hypothetical protein